MQLRSIPASCFRSSVKKLMGMAVLLQRSGGLEQVPDAAGEMAREAADGFSGGLAFASFAVEVGLGFGVAAGAGDRDPVQRGVELAVAAAVEAVAVGSCLS